MSVIVKMVNNMISMNFVVVFEHFQPTTSNAVAFARAALLVSRKSTSLTFAVSMAIGHGMYGA
jgi:hypothetical protein